MVPAMLKIFGSSAKSWGQVCVRARARMQIFGIQSPTFQLNCICEYWTLVWYPIQNQSFVYINVFFLYIIQIHQNLSSVFYLWL